MQEYKYTNTRNISFYFKQTLIHCTQHLAPNKAPSEAHTQAFLEIKTFLLLMRVTQLCLFIDKLIYSNFTSQPLLTRFS